MLDFLKWRTRHIPDDFIESQDRWFLWDMEGNLQAVLTFEDWELRIYTYDWNSSDDEPEEEWRRWCWDVFQNFTGYYDENSLGYVKVDTSGSIAEIIGELYKSCEQQLLYFYSLTKDATAEFIEKHSDKINKENRVYTYYK